MVNARPIRQFVDQSQRCTGKEEEVGEEEEERRGRKKGKGEDREEEENDNTSVL